MTLDLTPKRMLSVHPQRTLIYGLGRSGIGVVRHLEWLGWSGAWFDRSENPLGADEAVQRGFARVTTLEPNDFDLVVAAPGVMYRTPDLGFLRSHGLETIGEAELCYRTLPTPTIGVTGTAGKGSTTALIAHLLQSQGVNALPGGNFDPPLLSVARQAEVVVTELSSFQLERIVSYRPRVAVITNIGVDHVTDHGSLEAYHAAKWMLVKNLMPEDALVLPENLPLGRETPARMVHVSLTGPIATLENTVLIEVSELPPHQHPMNARLAVMATLLYLERIGKQANLEALRLAVLDFPGVPGRFETVGVIAGTRFIEDSIATRTIAVQAALKNAPAPIAWVLGGRDKGAELGPLMDVAKCKVAVILRFGESGEVFSRPFAEAGIPVVDCSHANGTRALEQAVRVGFERARGGSVVLAPLGTSFDQFKDYKARGQAFRDAVSRLKAELREAT
jgi:UDP-N-acetylmuramoylalanine--D-glutamate ligase